MDSNVIGDVFKLAGTISVKTSDFFKDMAKVNEEITKFASTLGKEFDTVTKEMQLTGKEATKAGNSASKALDGVTKSGAELEHTLGNGQLTKPLTAFDAAAQRTRQVFSTVVSSIGSMVNTMVNSTINGIDRIGKSMDNMGSKMENFGYNLKNAAVTAAAALTLHSVIDKAASLEMTQVQLGAVYGVGKTDKFVQDKTAESRELAGKTMFSSTEVMQIVTELAHAGIKQEALMGRDAKGEITGVGRDATFLAEIEKGLGKSESPQRTAYNFGRMVDDAGIQLDQKKMDTFADSITRLINITHANTESLGETFKMAMPVTKSLGWNESDLLMASGMAARAGMEGTMAGTHIKDFAQRTNPYNYLGGRGKVQLNAMQEFGLLEGVTYKKSKAADPKIVGVERDILHDETGKLKTFEEVSQILHERIKVFMAKNNNNQEKLSAVLNHIFGEQGQDFALIASHTENLARLKDQMYGNKAKGVKGTMGMEEQITEIRGTFEAQKKIFFSNIANILISIGTPLIQALNPFLQKMSGIAVQINKYLTANPQVAKGLGFLLLGGVGIGVLGTAVGVIGTILRLFGTGVRGIGLFAKGIREVFRLFGMFGGIAGKGGNLFSWIPGASRLIGSLFRGGVAAARLFGQALGLIMRGGGSAFMWLVRTIASLGPVFLRVGSFVLNFGRVFLTIFSWIAKIFRFVEMAGAAGEAIGALIGVLSGPIGWIVLAIVGVIALIIWQWKNIKNWFINNDIWGGLKNGFWKAVKFLHDIAQSIVTSISHLFSGLGNFLSYLFSKKMVDDLVNGLGTALRWIEGLPGRLWNAGKNMIGALIDGFKSLNIPTPHFNLDWGNIMQGVLPKMSVDWYAKGGVFNGPNVIGVGEKGPEAVLPLKTSVFQQIGQAIAHTIGGGGGSGKSVIIQNATFAINVKKLQTKDDIEKMRDAIQTVASNDLFGMAVRNI